MKYARNYDTIRTLLYCGQRNSGYDISIGTAVTSGEVCKNVLEVTQGDKVFFGTLRYETE